MMNKGKIIVGIFAACVLFVQGVTCVIATEVDESNMQNQEIIENQEQTGSEPEVETETGTPIVEDMDTGDYSKVMVVGETQLLTITLLPLDVSGEIQYISSDETVVTVNGLGRITAVGVGTGCVTIRCQEVSKNLSIIVEEPKEEEVTEVLVTDIDLGNYKTEVDVDGTISLSATVIPSNATDATVTYSSSNKEIATITSQGEIKGISSGKTLITIQAGNITKRIEMEVKVAGKIIQLNTTYVVLKVGQTWQLKATSIPKESSQIFTYKASDTSVASVTKGGLITGKKIGSTSIIVRNEDVTNAVTVIVNNTSEQLTTDIGDTDSEDMKSNKETMSTEEVLLEQIKNKREVVVKAKEYELITTTILRALHEQGTTLIIEDEDYSMILDGNAIVNYQNELKTAVIMEETNIGLEIIVNDGNPLPCAVEVKRLSKDDYPYLYLFHESKGVYEKLTYKSGEGIRMDVEGRYVLSHEKLQESRIYMIYIVVAGIIVIGLIGTYIYMKKKHWFW